MIVSRDYHTERDRYFRETNVLTFSSSPGLIVMTNVTECNHIKDTEAYHKGDPGDYGSLQAGNGNVDL